MITRTLAALSLAARSLAARSLAARSLAARSLSARSLSARSLSARSLSAALSLLAALSLSATLAPPAAAQSTPPVQPTLVIDGTVLEVQTGVPRCGVLATSFWARVRIDRLLTPLGGLLPGEITVRVQCPGTVSVGDQRRFELVSPRPTRGSWTMFGVEPASNPALYWTLRVTPVPAPAEARPTR